MVSPQWGTSTHKDVTFDLNEEYDERRIRPYRLILWSPKSPELYPLWGSWKGMVCRETHRPLEEASSKIASVTANVSRRKLSKAICSVRKRASHCLLMQDANF